MTETIEDKQEVKQEINEINNQQINEEIKQEINEEVKTQINKEEDKLYDNLESIDSESVISENSKKLKNYRFYILFEVYLNFSNKITKDELIKLFNDFYDSINEIFGRKENYLYIINSINNVVDITFRETDLLVNYDNFIYKAFVCIKSQKVFTINKDYIIDYFKKKNLDIKFSYNIAKTKKIIYNLYNLKN